MKILDVTLEVTGHQTDLGLSKCQACQDLNAVGTGRVTVNKRKLIKWMMTLSGRVRGQHTISIVIPAAQFFPIKTVIVEYYFHPITSFRIEFDLQRPPRLSKIDCSSIQLFLDENSLSNEQIVEIAVKIPRVEKFLDVKLVATRT